MEHWFTKNVTVYTGEIKPRTVQKLMMRGVTCAVFTAAEAKPGVWIFEDIDGTKLLAYVPAGEADANAQAARRALEALPETMPDIPVCKIGGLPNDTGLLFPVNGVYENTFAPLGNETNIALKTMRVTQEGAVLTFYETAGKETDFSFFCDSPELGFKALFSPWEIKRFEADKNGRVKEIDFTNDTDSI